MFQNVRLQRFAGGQFGVMVKVAWVQVPFLLLVGCVTFGKCLYLFMHHQ